MIAREKKAMIKMIAHMMIIYWKVIRKRKSENMMRGDEDKSLRVV